MKRLRESTRFRLSDPELFKKKALEWARGFNEFMLLNSNNHFKSDPYHTEEWLLAAGALNFVRSELADGAMEALGAFLQTTDERIYGFLNYNLKEIVGGGKYKNDSYVSFPYLYFFDPRYVLRLRGDDLEINRNYPESAAIYDLIMQTVLAQKEGKSISFSFEATESKEDYLQKVELIKEKIRDGEFYELNYCLEFRSETNLEESPVELYHRLNEKSPNPFSTLLRVGDLWLLCASPERFLARRKDLLIAQPIKGTAAKSGDQDIDRQRALELQRNPKERAENAMIVDLMRNDLARVCETGSVEVRELFGVYVLPSVIQMISTVCGRQRSEVDVVEILKSSFPMGSMTGAPKTEVMKQIDDLETFNRGIYSGAAGYLSREGDFDLNVVIRSIQTDAGKGRVAFQAGGAITLDSEPESEYAEIRLKIRPLLEVLGGRAE